MHAVTFFDGEGWRDGVLSSDGGRMLLRDEPPPAELPRFDGVIAGGFTDHHVHLQLVDHALLAGSRLGRVVDLGGSPEALAGLAVHNSGVPAARPTGSGAKPHDLSLSSRDSRQSPAGSPELWTAAGEHPVAVEFAGAFLTPVGGYPSDRSWAPAGSFREIVSAADAAAAVAEMADAGASCIKVASNSAAGPVFEDDLFRAIVAAAAQHALPVVTHAEGPGQAQRAARLGAATLAHAPFSERLTDEEIAEQAASVSWISTLAIHDGPDRERAVDNVRRFHAAGGAVRYGTDMGNGPTPVDLNPHELAALREAGIDGLALLRALAPQNPLDPASALLRLPSVDAVPESAQILKV